MRKLIATFLNFLGIKQDIEVNLKKIRLFYIAHFKNSFNLNVLRQNMDYKSIPIIIISFNQLYYLKQLIGFLKKCNYTNIIIIDNNSTYIPLLDYFETIASTVTIHKLKENYGHLVFWKHKELFAKYSKGYYVVTDPDIVPVEDCSKDFVLHFKKILDKNFQVTKVGFSLKIDNIPDSNPNKQKVIDWEQQFWKNKTKDGNYIADIDTTFALYKPKYEYEEFFFYKSIRTKKPYLAMHGGWYLDTKNLTEEQNFYFATCNDSSSWRINEQGELHNQKSYN
uniref:glycosyltransferase family 2 protein n=1 Tax=Mariniflexile sp. TaxID=1979402 RepID=UPI0040480F33